MANRFRYYSDLMKDYFSTRWEEEQPAVDLQLPNEQYTPSSTMPYIRLNIMETSATAVSSGGLNNRIRHPGMISVGVYSPSDGGDYQNLALSDIVADILEEMKQQPPELDGIVVRVPRREVVGTSENEAFYKSLIISEFYYDRYA